MAWQPRTMRAAPDNPADRLEEHILRLLAETPKPFGAYDLLPLVMRLEKRRMYASQIYRALDRLIGAGLVERVESASGYLLRRGEATPVLICTRCGSALQAEGKTLLTFE
jgi:Fe2+ or Zn2+ uptake regulation protein